MKTVIFEIKPGGEVKIETDGFSGNECLSATKAVKDALGAGEEVAEMKPEAFETQAQTETVYQ